MFQLPESITVFNSEEVLESLSKYINNIIFGQNSNEQVILNARELTDIDGAGLQLLLSAYKTCELKNIPYSITELNDEIMALLDITGTKVIVEREEA
ncbi:STAS domain-containing protein [Desulfuribacillus alkaliarsenatis]|uniref:STAS domain-containing protein n=1 Tax=Desulfuribacillus alkaliarsenatis TaxID=766136 RepID=A0A1E5FZ54_9FIRM|nr:STAS domain-containing protein [Desulfuribacillus alkaliarsenatis]OEF95819.1 hypothetical protein BHF68_10490 [Desulfuribacillus alkaliarsenatis]